MWGPPHSPKTSTAARTLAFTTYVLCVHRLCLTGWHAGCGEKKCIRWHTACLGVGQVQPPATGRPSENLGGPPRPRSQAAPLQAPPCPLESCRVPSGEDALSSHTLAKKRSQGTKPNPVTVSGTSLFSRLPGLHREVTKASQVRLHLCLPQQVYSRNLGIGQYFIKKNLF